MASSNFDIIRAKIQSKTAFKAKYKTPEMRRLLPYVLGWSLNTSGASEEVCLCYEFTNPNPHKAGWRCFKVELFTEVGDSNKPLPSPEPVCDCDRQNCVTDIEEHRC